MKKNILIIGRAGSGKSALANTLVNQDGKFKEIFKESSGSVNVVKNCQEVTFEDNEGNEYRIIDTVSFSDTNLSEEDVILKLAEVVAEFRGGVNQIFFVSNGRFIEEDVKIFGLLMGTIFDQDMFKFTTIIRTSFPEFEDDDKCKKDYQNLTSGEEIGSEVVKKIEKVIYVNNPPVKTSGTLAKQAPLNKEIREESREKLLNHLATFRSVVYEPSKLREFNKEINKLTGSSLFTTLEVEEKDKKKKTLSQKIIEQNYKTIKESTEAGVNLGRQTLPIIGAPVGGLLGFGTSVVFSALYSGSEAIESIFKSKNKNEEQSSDFQSENSWLKIQNANLQKQIEEKNAIIKQNQNKIVELEEKNKTFQQQIANLEGILISGPQVETVIQQPTLPPHGGSN